jgi:DNA-binding NarL/FixJ family response regulator
MATKSGYGRTWINDVGYYAHRVIYNLAHPGEIELKAPKDKKAFGFLMHTCDNRICCNPAHLRVADIKTNNEDCVRKGRRVLPKGEDHHRSVFTNDEIRQVLEMWKLGLTARQIGMNLNKKRATIQSLLRRIRLREGN